MPHKVDNPLSTEVDTSIQHGDWRDDLFRDGFAVVKGVIGPDKAAYYVDRMFQWVENFPLAFNRQDPSTWTPENLPRHQK